jgi:cell division control protein 6
MGDIFDRIKDEETRTLYKEEAIFGADYSPKSMDEVLDREHQKEEIAKTINKVTKGVRSELYIFGITGVGKTYTVKAILESAPKDWKKKFRYAWVNCKNIHPISNYQILNEISVQIGKRWSKGHATKDIENYLIEKHEARPLLIVLDEVDVLAKVSDELLYTFSDKGISQILISNVFNWVDECDDRIKSRSTNNRVDFGAYTRDEMKNILRFIANKGLKEGVIGDDMLEKIADHTSTHFLGDVRKAKNLISNCVDEAMKEGASEVTEEHLEKAYQKVKPTSLKDILKNFSVQEQVTLASFVAQQIDLRLGHVPATTESVHNFYTKLAELNGLESVTATMMKNYMRRLESSGILEHETKSYESRGRTNIYHSIYEVKDLVTALKGLGIKFPWSGDLKEKFG